MMNPAAILKLNKAFGKFQSEHPKCVAFFRDVFMSGIPEGTIVEVSVTKPGQEKMTTNIKVKQSDLELFESLKDLK